MYSTNSPTQIPLRSSAHSKAPATRVVPWWPWEGNRYGEPKHGAETYHINETLYCIKKTRKILLQRSTKNCVACNEVPCISSVDNGRDAREMQHHLQRKMMANQLNKHAQPATLQIIVVNVHTNDLYSYSYIVHTSLCSPITELMNIISLLSGDAGWSSTPVILIWHNHISTKGIRTYR